MAAAPPDTTRVTHHKGLGITEGILIINNLPTADPHVLGQLWNDAGTIKVSAGPPG